MVDHTNVWISKNSEEGDLRVDLIFVKHSTFIYKQPINYCCFWEKLLNHLQLKYCD